MAQATEVVVGGILLRDGQVLLGKRSSSRVHYPTVWDVVGGHVEDDESLERALARELREEVGIEPREYRALVTIEIPQTPTGERLICHFFCVTAWDGEPRNRQPEEHAELRWFPLQEVGGLELADPSYVRLFQSLIESLPDRR